MTRAGIRLLVTGRHGQVARSLTEAAASDPHLVIACLGRAEVDLMSPLSIAHAVNEFRPDVIVNTAAYTAVDKAEAEADLAFAINADAAGNVARVATEYGVPIIHFSTDYVFDGLKNGAYSEHDAVRPQSVYGQSKLAGERAVSIATARHVILRTSWVYAPFGRNFARTILGVAQRGAALRVVNDQKGRPTYAPDLADAVLTIARLIAFDGWKDDYAGVTHIAGPDILTWYDFAREIVQRYDEMNGVSTPILPIATSEYPTAAVRPANSVLSIDRLRNVLGVEIPTIMKSLPDCVRRLAAIA